MVLAADKGFCPEKSKFEVLAKLVANLAIPRRLRYLNSHRSIIMRNKDLPQPKLYRLPVFQDLLVCLDTATRLEARLRLTGRGRASILEGLSAGLAFQPAQFSVS